MDPAYEMAEDLKSEVAINGWKIKQVFKKRDQFAPELVYFSDCILNDKQPEPSGQEGLADVRVVEALLKSAETNRPVSIAQVNLTQRPNRSQEISKKPIKPPQLVRAAAPGAE
jgi:glucose-fructose oxidoreductase